MSLPADARIDVQSIDTVTLTSDDAQKTNVLLRPVTREGAEHSLPDYCLIMANASLDGDRMRVISHAATCIDAQTDEPDIFSGHLQASGMERDGSYGLNVCENQREETCQRAVLTPDHHFQLVINEDTEIPALENPSKQINEMRRHAEGEGNANPLPAERPEPAEAPNAD
ncbi:hypothetical protein GCM10027040_23620 [Halomonas shantousis]